MTVIGKLLALLNLVVGLALLTWAVNLYTQRPSWFAPIPEGGVSEGQKPASFPLLKAEIDSLTRTAGAATQVWGAQKEGLEDREALRIARRQAFARRIAWAHNGNPADRIDKDNPASLGKGFYAPTIIDLTVLKADLTQVQADLRVAERSGETPDTKRLREDVRHLELAVKLYPLVDKLYDPRPDPTTGIPRGAAVLGTDGQPLPGLDKLVTSLADDVAQIVKLDADIVEQRELYDQLAGEVTVAQARVAKMRDIRDDVLAELFYLSTFEVNVYETRETVLRREQQLRGRLKILGITNP